jgi:hypothetical protein
VAVPNMPDKSGEILPPLLTFRVNSWQSVKNCPEYVTYFG